MEEGNTHRYLRRLKHVFRHMSRTTFFTYPLLHRLDQLLRELSARFHKQEQQYGFVSIGRASLTHANAVLNVVGEKGFDHIVNFCAAETHARGV